MSGITKRIILLAASLVLAACSNASENSTLIAVPNPVTSSPEPSASPGATSTPTPSETPPPQPYVIYDFVQLACQAMWSNNGQALPCPGEQWHTIGSGYVGLIEDPVMEGNVKLSEEGLLTHPSNAEGYYGIFGKYPRMMIRAGDEFRATIGCLHGIEAESCDVQYSIDFVDAAGSYHANAWTWPERYDGQLTEISADLSPLAGRTVQLVLVVRDNGSPFGDYAMWLHPQLWRLSR